MKIKGRYSESAPLYAILLSVGAVLAVVVFFIVLNATGGEEPGAEIPASDTATATEAPEPVQEDDTGYAADEALAEEMKDAAERLIADNYIVLKYYYTQGMAHKDEPYGNEPEDGYYTVDSKKYTSIDQLEEIVDRTFVPEFAESVKTDPLGYGPVYKTRSSGELGIFKDFTPMPYDKVWKDPSPKYEIEPISDTDCKIKLTLHYESDKSDAPVDAEMIKTDDGWRLTQLVR